MADEEIGKGGGAPDAGRRKLLKIAAAAGGAVAATAILPGTWSKPIARIGALPAHAQASDTPFTLTNAQLLGLTFLDAARSQARVASSKMIQVQCRWEDPLAEFGPYSNLHTLVNPGGCTTNAQVSDLSVYPYWHISYDDPYTNTAGYLVFNVNTPCYNGSNLEWYVTDGPRSTALPYPNVNLNVA